jgi:asparagine synthase (glutamine-hydrolysing)
MCGIAGFLEGSGAYAADARGIMARMTAAIAHRGPDAAGEWLDAAGGIALGHRRLSILDLSAAGQQPMVSDSGRYVIVFNGEIYNHVEIRQHLARDAWRGHSDTETLLAAIEAWGLQRALRASAGMFALAVWDREKRILQLARDRIGEKPLYYGWQKNTFIFASELKALRVHPSCGGEIARDAVAMFVRLGYIPAPYSIYRGVWKLLPGHVLEVAADGDRIQSAPEAYWDLSRSVTAAVQDRFDGSAEQAVDELEQLLRQVIGQQQIADVPLGAFLSGGIDSSLVAALMQVSSGKPVRTFSIAFEERGYNEAHHARSVAAHLKTDHAELTVTARDTLAIIPQLPSIYDEPFADASQIPTAVLCQWARRHVTVALSGDGGDEIFCGYDRYPNVARHWRRLSAIPLGIRRALKNLMPAGPVAEGFACAHLDAFYGFVNAQWKGHPTLVRGESLYEVNGHVPAVLSDSTERMMYADAAMYLPDDLLVKVDRAAMAASLETRVPLVDHRMV